MDCLRNALPLHKYKDKYYLYAPSDWGNAGKRIIADTALVNWYMDGPYLEQLQNVTKVSPSKYILTSRNFYDTGTSYKQLIIHIIDRKNKIAIWEYPIANYSSHYEMYVAKENAKNFDLIVNYCEQSKVVELDFDKIDYKALIK